MILGCEREGCFIYEPAWDDDDIIITLNSKKRTHTQDHSPKTYIYAIHSTRRLVLLLLRDKILCPLYTAIKHAAFLFILFNAYLMVVCMWVCERQSKSEEAQLLLPAWLTAIWINCRRPWRGDQICAQCVCVHAHNIFTEREHTPGPGISIYLSTYACTFA